MAESRAGAVAALARGRATTFGLGLAVTAGALVPPLDHAAASCLTAHMVQHVLLIAIAPPLLAIGLPGVAGPLRTGWAAAALVVQAAVMWAWHAPGLYEAALRHEALHAIEHLSLLGTATAFWWALDLRRPSGGGPWPTCSPPRCPARPSERR